jgi:hypothetical protein
MAVLRVTYSLLGVATIVLGIVLLGKNIVYLFPIAVGVGLIWWVKSEQNKE